MDNSLNNPSRVRNAQLACWSLFFWSFGNTLVSTTLITYIFFRLVDGDFVWRSTVTALLLAAPQIFRFVRLFAPKILARIRWPLPWQSALFYTFSGLFILVVPALAFLKGSVPIGLLVALLVGLWSAHHLNEYVGNIALDTWIGRLIESKRQGYYYALRQRYSLVGAMAASGMSFLIKGFFPDSDLLQIWACVGAVIIILSNAPLLGCQNFPERQTDEKRKSQDRQRSVSLFGPLKSFSFCLFIFYGVCFSFVSGLSQSAQFQFIYQDLNVGFESFLVFLMIMRTLQMILSYMFGKMSDRSVAGNRIAMTISQCFAAAGLLALAFATKENGLILLAYVLWAGYVGLNVGVPKHLQLLGGETGERAACFSLYYAAGGICYSSSLILSGIALDLIQRFVGVHQICFTGFSYFGTVLLVCAGLRFLMVPLTYLCVRGK